LIWDGRNAFPATVEKFGIVWQGTPFGMEAGTRCDGSPIPDSGQVNLPAPVAAHRLAIVSSLGCGAALPTGAESLVVELRGAEYASRNVLRAGVDTAEFALACDEVARVSRHGQGRVFEAVNRTHSSCFGQRYLAVIEPPSGTVSELHVSYAAPEGFGRIDRLSVLDADGKTVAVLGKDPGPSALQAPRWRYAGSFSNYLVLENLRALPKAWAVGSVTSVGSEAEELGLLRGERMLDGQPWSPRHTAITVDGPALSEVPGESAVEVRQWGPGSISLDAVTSRPALIVVSAQHYPGWVASISGTDVPLYRVNHSLIGIPIQPGTHRVDLEFAPPRLKSGLAVSVWTIIGILVIFVLRRRRALADSHGTNA
jgi:hypothetical protein